METKKETEKGIAKKKALFIEGPIAPDFIAQSIAKHQSKTGIGAHDIFLGQVRADEIDGKTVTGIAYTAYEEMAHEKMHEIREDLFGKYDLSCMHIYHSLGEVAVGEICLFVFVSSPHRKAVFEALHELVERIKKELPVFGKELFGDDSYAWKVNK
ncbi:MULTISPECIES: molybdenum cofactor biosynthesis protein MoaE [Robiginitalea]|uniref:Molybdopterin synthase catalytic subunit n=1 Tax=Robiginitalea biformata (strain ATCC BAA-864 / DSM 15991 / KCTC 12146 / HTCC2501) TaxID=313596 RepID=A4CH76_ROBBH|nr:MULTISPECIES: molybdenum cofactor biosynthesis protein MoaE [Robiginitalea]EAR16284.1 molybdopterinconverting factor, subunit [Robiginitalea biformata HTCC2501]MDC6353442.1 molybdenum cofactor biosynthesis protein MoaE [Robiginitalea sp. PM2]MDC6373393.1 molybdenum cofactor biosynthesis protein MoaE [Robiginitalea sp. SP8]